MKTTTTGYEGSFFLAVDLPSRNEGGGLKSRREGESGDLGG
ncbi:MAG: hypothetical protein ACFNOQ_01870 [Porphyromonas sp.]